MDWQSTPFFPPSGPARRLAQGPPVRSKFLAACCVWIICCTSSFCRSTRGIGLFRGGVSGVGGRSGGCWGRRQEWGSRLDATVTGGGGWLKLEREGFGEKRSGTADASQRLRYVGEGEACDPVFAEATTGTRDKSFASGYGGQAGQATLGVIRLGGWKPPPRVGHATGTHPSPEATEGKLVTPPTRVWLRGRS